MIEIGSPTAEALFRARHSRFFEGAGALARALSLAFDRAFDATDPLGAVIFFLGSRCADDFREVMLLAAHGHGWGATAHVRGMFERCVTAAYLHENPGAVSDFIDYDLIRRWKLAESIKGVIELSPAQKTAKEQLKAAVEGVKERFMVSVCKKCGTKRVNHTWSKLDLVAMAGQVKKMKTMPSLVSQAYYQPLDQAHGTLSSIIQRIGQVGGAHFAVDESLGAEQADTAFETAHLLVLNALVVQQEQFKLPELENPVGEAFAHFRAVWEGAAGASSG